MIQPDDCPYIGLTMKMCHQCPRYNADMDACMGTTASQQQQSAVTAADCASTYEDRLRRYEHDRHRLLELPKEALVDLILRRPTMY